MGPLRGTVGRRTKGQLILLTTKSGSSWRTRTSASQSQRFSSRQRSCLIKYIHRCNYPGWEVRLILGKIPNWLWFKAKISPRDHNPPKTILYKMLKLRWLSNSKYTFILRRLSRNEVRYCPTFDAFAVLILVETRWNRMNHVTAPTAMAGGCSELMSGNWWKSICGLETLLRIKLSMKEWFK